MRWAIAGIVIASGVLVGCGQSSSSVVAGEPSAWTVEKRRELAGRLSADGFDDQAIVIYEKLLDEGVGLSEKQMAAISLSVADLHIAGLRWERAITSLYRASLFDESGAFKSQIDEKRIVALKRLGRHGEAGRILDQTTALGAKTSAEDAGGDELLAKVGDEVLTRADFEVMLENVPAELKAQLEEKAVRAQVLRSFVSQMVLVRAARGLGYDKDEKVRLAIELASREVLVKKMMAESVREKVEVSADDVRLYFEAKRDRFREPTRMEVSEIIVADESAEQALRAKLAAGTSFADLVPRGSAEEGRDSQGRLAQPLVEGRFHPRFVDVAKTFEAIADSKAGEVVASAVLSSRGRHILRVEDRREGRDLSFEEVKEQAGAMLRSEREQAALKSLLDEALKRPEVTLYEERL